MTISRFMDFNKELQDYIDGKFNLTPILNILMNDRSVDWYVKLGKYFVDHVGSENLKLHSTLLKRLNGSRSDKETSYRMFGIYFITAYLNEDSLKEMFGKPVCHSEFGEGFDEKIKYEFCSYFVDMDGHKIHIGYDHRGTIIEVEKNLKPEEVYKILIELVDTYIDMCL